MSEHLNPAETEPITLWIDELRNADDSAARRLWNHYVNRLYESARRRLRPETKRVYDEEDAAQSAFHSVCAGITAGRFPDLHDRECLWKLLLVTTSRKIGHRHRYDHQQRRDIRRNQTNAVFIDDAGSYGHHGVENIAAHEPTPEFAAEFEDTCESLFQSLCESDLRDVAALRLEGFNESEIAKRLNCSRRTVQRRMEAIRRCWKKYAGP